MKNVKVIVAALLVFILVAAGCSSNTPDNKAETQGNTSSNTVKSESPASNDAQQGAKESEPAAPKPEDIKAKVTWWAAWSESTGPGDMIKKFNEKYPNIEVEYVQFPNTPEGNVKLDTALLAGQGADVFFNYGTKYVDPRAKKNLLLDLSDFLGRDQFDVVEELGTDVYQHNDVYYSLPATSQSKGVWINKKALDEAGLTTPTEWTIDEYQDFARKLTKGSGANKFYGSSDSHSALDWMQLAYGLIGNDPMYNDQGLSNFDHPAFKRALEIKYNAENVEQYQYPYKEFKATKAQVFDTFITGKAAMAIMQNSMARVVNDTEQYPRDFLVEVAPLPTLEKGQTNYNSGVSYFGYLGISAKTKEQEASWALMKWLLTEGSADFAKVGHLPTWKKSDKDSIITTMFGENAASKINLEQVKRVLLDYESTSSQNNIFTANAELTSISTEEFEKAIYDQISVDTALTNMKKASDEAINRAEK